MGGLVFGLLLILGLVALLWFARKALLGWIQQDPSATSSAGFTLADLRALHRSGKMTDAEYELAKAQVVKRVQAAAARETGVSRSSPPPTPPEPD
ncbi:hypothetical protein [Fontivita pretiosa]|uniref:hypothetical protein n=1 Tax=Fontivita pretiosa TaxID=2989684 RepID=UPI003D176430